MAIGTEGGTIKVFNLLSGKSTAFKGHKSRCNSICYSSERKTLASSSNDSVIVYIFIYNNNNYFYYYYYLIDMGFSSC